MATGCLVLNLIWTSQFTKYIFCFSVTNITICRGLCNLGSLENVRTDQSSTYRYSSTYNYTYLTADRAVNGKFLVHEAGDCAGTDVLKIYNQSWWNISLPDLADIYKINLMFRQNCKFANPESSNALTTWKCKYIVWENRNIYCAS